MPENLTIHEEIFINQYAQHIHSLETMDQWFNSKDIFYKKKIVHGLLLMVIQAHPTYEEIFDASVELKVERSPVAVKLMNKNKPYSKFGYELLNLPEADMLNCFNLLLEILSIADNRRRQICCINGCTHWWHQDLSDPSILETLRQSDK